MNGLYYFLKRRWLKKEGLIINKENTWAVDIEKLIAVDLRTINKQFYSLYKGNVIGTKYGSWTFFSHIKLNPDVLDTLRFIFVHERESPPRSNIKRIR